MAWKKQVKVKNKNCKSISEIETRMRGRYKKDSYTPYRAVVNALVGGGVPEVGAFEVEAEKLQGITKIYISKEYVYIERRGEIQKRRVTGIQSNISHFYKGIEQEVKREIKMLEGNPSKSAELEMEIYSAASKYRDILEQRERVAPQETRTIMSIVDLPGMTELREVVINLNSFGELENLGPQDMRILNKYQGLYQSIIGEVYKKEIMSVMGKKQYPKNIVRVAVSKVDNVDYIEGSIRPKQPGQETVYYQVSKEMQEAEMLDTRVEEAIERFGVYAEYLSIVEDMSTVHVPYERTLWANSLDHSRIRRVVEEEYTYHKEMGREKYSKPVALRALIEYNKERFNNERMVNIIGVLQDFTPLYSRDNRQTIKSMGIDRETREGLKRYKEAVETLENVVEAVIEALNGVFVSTMIDLTSGEMEKWSIQSGRIPNTVEHGEFYYTESLLESVNRIQRKDMGIERGTGDYRATRVKEVIEKLNGVKIPEGIKEKGSILEAQVGRLMEDFEYLTEPVRDLKGLTKRVK